MGESYGAQRETAGASLTMIRVIRICRKCGARILSDAPEGVCARCMLKIGLGTFAETCVAGVGLSAVASAKADDPGRLDDPARDREKGTRAAELRGELGEYELLGEV